jgi:hypothetical protein
MPAVRSGALERLVDTARALRGDRFPVSPAVAPAVETELVAADIEVRALRGRLGQLFLTLAQRLDPALTNALRHAAVAWDEFDEVAVMDAELRREAAWIAAAAAALEREVEPSQRAVGMEVRIALAAALGLVDLIERRLAMLVRLRVQSEERSLLPGYRPFLDVAAALTEAARGFI